MFDQGKGRLQCRADAAGRHDVVFLDQDAVEQADAVVVSAAGAHRVLERHAQAGNGFARIQNARVGTGNGLDVALRLCGDAR